MEIRASYGFFLSREEECCHIGEHVSRTCRNHDFRCCKKISAETVMVNKYIINIVSVKLQINRSILFKINI